jgi:Methyltransferase domain
VNARSVYSDYWRRKRLLAEKLPHFPIRQWWRDDSLCDIEEVYLQAVAGSASLLDIGAGDLRIMRRFQAAGYRGDYHTLDIGDEYEYTYADLSEVEREYEAILCLDVIEHLPLNEGLELLDRLLELLSPGGVLVIQTPNARCIRHPLGWDMTHLHCYNLPDLWGYLSSRGLSVSGYRVVLGPRRRGLAGWTRFLISAFLISRLLGSDHADNIALIARKEAVV